MGCKSDKSPACGLTASEAIDIRLGQNSIRRKLAWVSGCRRRGPRGQIWFAQFDAGDRKAWRKVEGPVTLFALLESAPPRQSSQASACGFVDGGAHTAQKGLPVAHRPQWRTYSITSSARTRIEVGKVRSSALAVFMLITRANFVARWIGKSAGLSPLRMRPAYTPMMRQKLSVAA